MNEGLLERGRQRRAFERFRQAPQAPSRTQGVEPGSETGPAFGEPDHCRHTHAKQFPGQLGVGIRHEHHRHPRPVTLEPRQQADLLGPNPAMASDHHRLNLTVESGERFGRVRHTGAGARGSAYVPGCLERVRDHKDHVGFFRTGRFIPCSRMPLVSHRMTSDWNEGFPRSEDRGGPWPRTRSRSQCSSPPPR